MRQDIKKKQRKFEGLPQAKAIIAIVLSLVLLLAPWSYLYEASGGKEFRQLEDDIAAQESKLLAKRHQQIASTTARTGILASPTAASTSPPAATSAKADVQETKGPILKLPVAEPLPEDDWIFQDSMRYVSYFNQTQDELYLDLDVYAKYRDLPLSMIGDSVSVITSYHIFYYLPNLQLDALSNRQMHELWSVYEQMKQENLLREMLVVALGSNGDVSPEALEQVWHDLDGKPLLLVNIVLPYAQTEDTRNKDIVDFVDTHDNVYLVDWHGASKTHPDYFQEDYIHPSELGCKAFCQLLTKKLFEIAQDYDEEGRLEFYQNNSPLSPSSEQELLLDPLK